jgi:serine/threonine-protein kinase ATR
MVRSLDDVDVGPLLEDTFSAIVMHWKAFDSASRVLATELIVHLLKQRPVLLRKYIDVIPSLQVPELAEYEKELEKMRQETDVWQQYRTFCRRLTHEHESVVTQALTELATYLRKHQSFLQASAISEQPDSVVGDLLRAILDSCVKFGGGNLLVARLAAECIGMIGCLDPNRVAAVREHKEIVCVSNFEESEDIVDFVLFILEEVLVGAFLSANNPQLQGFFSWAMQELLERVGIRGVCLKPELSSATEGIYNKWLSVPETVRQTLTPFLTSRYKLAEPMKIDITYPIFQPDRKYAFWIRSFVLDLLNRPHNKGAEIIFPPLCRVIKIEDLSAANFLLPFVVLHAVVAGTDEQRAQIREELLRILTHEAPADSHFERTNLRLCSEVRTLSK